MIDVFELMRFLIAAVAVAFDRWLGEADGADPRRQATPPRPHRNAIQTVVPEPLT